MVKRISAILVLLVAVFAVAPGCTRDSDATVATSVESSDEDDALEVALWGMPVVSFFAQKEASLRDVGAEPNQITYWSKPLDHNVKFLTPNNVTLYIASHIETFDGPVVFEVPAADGKLGIFGSLLDPFMVPLEDIGGENGIDKSQGGKILITPPGYSEAIPPGYLHVPSAHYNTVAGLRVTPVSFEADDIEDAISYIKKMKVYPFEGDSESTVYVDAGNKPYDPRPPYDENYFRLLDTYVQTEAHKPIDASFIAKLEQIGIAKGKKFMPDDSYAKAATRAWEQLQTDFRGIGDQFFPGAHWTTPVSPSESASQFTYVDEDGNYDWRSRAQTFHWAIWAPKHLGKATFYLVGQRDADGNVLKSSDTYELVVPPDVPAAQFWSVTVYEFETGGTFFDDVPTVAISSKDDDLVIAEDGTVALTVGANLPQGRPATNHIPTKGNGHWFALFRWYGPQPQLMPAAGSERWLMGDFTKLD
ncbi:DUF1214 domain-containing protein [Microbulbifer agarilyticus]|uniref:DUF1214 domain-containing protein n=1 Tax=Microbulbifer agarilyticus TaxID=260552 RepID=UPI001CD20D25|nr:DUF1214 domain-containing protein [Microbulbifer agarilyticus]MCA0899188.1 DUF1214 domain-containing protein [Microbulbifer agarilyticus]